ncbi:MAG: TatD family hydrolase [Gammaproteobacteria bacterium]|nr:TatD family hydrolase [Gammaproteobacteria bacterium]MCW8840539.1 TatD family hydrolase [Gammaproteobacteria bacterium]MCW8927920.1 TatD family hydrolase [Gammaproteobacteria bacterium]MCW8958041.1 TatD family hydrolase [Gammaproteobacteria bacterium]
MLVDSHCHLDRIDLEPFDNDLANALKLAGENGVERFLCVAIDRGNIPDVIAIAERFDNVYASVGIHPNEEDPEEVTAEELLRLADHPKVIAIGETGLDYFRSEGDLAWQKQRFRNHITASKACGKPLIIHSREAREDTIAIMREEHAEEAGGIMHCFVEDWDTAEKAMEMGFYISFSGIVTFKSAEALREVAVKVPAEKLLVETDSPYLAPVPHRGKGNHPAYVRHVAESLAEIRGESFESLARQTTDNFNRLFKL